MCENCRYKSTQIYVPSGTRPHLNFIEVKDINWYTQLLRCPECNSLWIKIMHEPYGMFEFIVYWRYGELVIDKISKLESNLIWNWQTTFITQNWKKLGHEDKKAVESYISRCYGKFPWATNKSFQEIEKEILAYNEA